MPIKAKNGEHNSIAAKRALKQHNTKESKRKRKIEARTMNSAITDFSVVRFLVNIIHLKETFIQQAQLPKAVATRARKEKPKRSYNWGADATIPKKTLRNR